MRIIKVSFLLAATTAHPRATEALTDWIAMIRRAKWTTPVEMKRSATDVDPVKVRSGRTVYVFNIRHNEFRLIVAVHFDRQTVFTLRFLTHSQYDQARWKEEL